MMNFKPQTSNIKTNPKSQDQRSKLFWILDLVPKGLGPRDLAIGICFGFWILMLGFISPAYTLENPEQRITKVIEDYVIAAHPDWAGLDIQVTFKYADKTFKSLSDVGDDANFKIVNVYEEFRPVGNVIFPIQVSDGDDIRKVFVRARVEVFKPIVITKKRIKRGSIITADDIAIEERDVAMLPQKYFEDKILVINNEAKTTMPRNCTIFQWMIKEIPLVHKGDDVAILVKGSNLLVKAQGIALTDGYPGKSVKVKRKNTKNRLEGILVSSSEVEVSLK